MQSDRETSTQKTRLTAPYISPELRIFTEKAVSELFEHRQTQKELQHANPERNAYGRSPSDAIPPVQQQATSATDAAITTLQAEKADLTNQLAAANAAIDSLVSDLMNARAATDAARAETEAARLNAESQVVDLQLELEQLQTLEADRAGQSAATSQLGTSRVTQADVMRLQQLLGEMELKSARVEVEKEGLRRRVVEMEVEQERKDREMRKLDDGVAKLTRELEGVRNDAEKEDLRGQIEELKNDVRFFRTNSERWSKEVREMRAFKTAVVAADPPRGE